ncbi:hypothetical protein Ddye_018295 [Dipteronia dyeriana]|uniref:Uncharacterized protein n=1 Tax=Dipteronia dyeriana TaxID=168575 RepID=A0AAD9X1C4_9ROSI|nr:hypothetical protein Ddye_018295 [Dipteronia dyeriana]
MSVEGLEPDEGWLRRSAVGVLKVFASVSEVNSSLIERGILFSTFYFGDKSIVWVFKSESVRDSFIDNRILWSIYFSSMVENRFDRGRILALVPYSQLGSQKLRVEDGSNSFTVSTVEEKDPVEEMWLQSFMELKTDRAEKANQQWRSTSNIFQKEAGEAEGTHSNRDMRVVVMSNFSGLVNNLGCQASTTLLDKGKQAMARKFKSKFIPRYNNQAKIVLEKGNQISVRSKRVMLLPIHSVKHSMNTRNKGTRKADLKVTSISSKEKWNLDVEIAKVVEAAVTVGTNIQAPPTEESIELFELEEEVAKVLEMGVSGF